MAEAVKKSRPRRVNTRAVVFSVWSANGGPLPETAVARIEAAIERETFELFNDGIRVLTQTNRG